MVAATKQAGRDEPVRRPDANRLLLHGISWERYLMLLEALEGCSVRTTYDRGRFEMMIVSSEHEQWSHLFNALLIVIALELKWPIKGLGTTTFSKRSLQRGLEPDQCYWLQNEARVRNVKRYDIEKHVPPDLVIEIDIAHSSLDRITVYESLGIQEVWRWDGNVLEVRVLSKGKYRLRKASAVLPGLKPSDLIPFLQMAPQVGETEMLRRFQEWVCRQVAAGQLKANE